MGKRNRLLMLLSAGGMGLCLMISCRTNKCLPESVASVNTQAMNPICPQGVYIADPEVRQMPDGRVYIYGSRDEPEYSWCSSSPPPVRQ